MRSSPPVIGLTTYLTRAQMGVWDVRASFLPQVYFKGVTEVGGAAVLLVPVLAIAGPGFLTSAGGAGLALYLGAIPTALAYVLFSRGLRSLTSGETATLVLAEPLTAAALGIVALGEQPSAAAGIGAGLVLAGLAVLAAPARSRLRTSKPAAATA